MKPNDDQSKSYLPHEVSLPSCVDMVGMLEAAIVKADDELIRCEGIGLLTLLGSLPEAEIVRRVLEKADGKVQG